MAKTDTAATETTVHRAVKLAAETVTPGASLILDGDLKLGLLHVIGAGLVRGLAGPLGVGLLALNSYAKSTTGKSLPEHLTSK